MLSITAVYILCYNRFKYLRQRLCHFILLMIEFFFIYDVTFVIDSITRAKIFIICACIWFVLIKFALLLRSAVIVVVNNSTVSLFNISGAGSGVSWHFLECCHKPFLDKYGLLHRLQEYVFRDDVSSVVAE